MKINVTFKKRRDKTLPLHKTAVLALAAFFLLQQALPSSAFASGGGRAIALGLQSFPSTIDPSVPVGGRGDSDVPTGNDAENDRITFLASAPALSEAAPIDFELNAITSAISDEDDTEQRLQTYAYATWFFSSEVQSSDVDSVEWEWTVKVGDQEYSLLTGTGQIERLNFYFNLHKYGIVLLSSSNPKAASIVTTTLTFSLIVSQGDEKLTESTSFNATIFSHCSRFSGGGRICRLSDEKVVQLSRFNPSLEPISTSISPSFARSISPAVHRLPSFKHILPAALKRGSHRIEAIEVGSSEEEEPPETRIIQQIVASREAKQEERKQEKSERAEETETQSALLEWINMAMPAALTANLSAFGAPSEHGIEFLWVPFNSDLIGGASEFHMMPIPEAMTHNPWETAVKEESSINLTDQFQFTSTSVLSRAELPSPTTVKTLPLNTGNTAN